MWIIQSLSDPGQSFRLLAGRDYSIGRRDCDILVENDMSISRKHASLSISHPENQVLNPQRLPILTLQDLSRLGSLVGEKRIVKESCIVQNGEMMVFGSAGVSRYRATYEPYITTTSCLDTPGKKLVRQLMGRLGGHVTNEWRKDCQLLIMNTLSITIKAICAMIAQRPIVTPLYVEDVVKSLEAGSVAPNSDDYLPPLAESQLDPNQVSFTADARRQTVFEGRLFIFLSSKQFKKLSIAVELAGGTPMLLEEKSADNEDMIVMPGSCVMSCDPADQSQAFSNKAQQWIRHVMSTLQKHKKRSIEESEIGYAVLYCSVDKHCNPDVESCGPGVNVPIPGQTLSQTDVTASQLRTLNTQNRNTPVEQHPAHSRPHRSNKEPQSEGLGTETGMDTASSRGAGSSRKRVRESVADSESAVSDAKKKLESLALVKDEPFTPADPTLTNNNSISMTPSNRGRGRIRRNSRSPSPNPVTERRVSPRSKRDTDLMEVDMDLQGRRHTRSASPAPPSPKDMRRNTRRHSPSPTKQDDKKGIFAKRSVAKKPAESDEETPIRQSRIKEEQISVNRGNISPDLLSDDGDDDSGGNSDGEVDMFSLVPTRKGRGRAVGSPPKRKRDSPSPVRERRLKKEEIQDLESDDFRIPETAEDMQIDQKPQPSTSRGRTRENLPAVNGNSSHHDEPQSASVVNSVTVKSENVFDTSLPTNVIVVEEVSLVVRNPGQTKKKTAEQDTWQGKIVKNFKKFRKVAHVGSHGLPRVIGGNDLVADESSQSKELDAWYNACIENETQQSQSEREAQDLFNFYSGANQNGKSKAKPTRGRKR